MNKFVIACIIFLASFYLLWVALGVSIMISALTGWF